MLPGSETGRVVKKFISVFIVILSFCFVWMNRYVYIKSTGEMPIKVMRIDRFTGRYQYSQMRGDGVWTDNINEHPKPEPAAKTSELPLPRPLTGTASVNDIDLSAGLVPKNKK